MLKSAESLGAKDQADRYRSGDNSGDDARCKGDHRDIAVIDHEHVVDQIVDRHAELERAHAAQPVLVEAGEPDGDDTDEQARFTEAVFATERGPVRVCCLYFPNGVWQEGWIPKETGYDWAAPFSLTPLEPVRDHAGTVFLVSHNAQTVEQFCDRAIWLEQGKVIGSTIYGPRAIAVRGNYDDVNRLCSEVADKYGWAFVNINVRPYYTEGAKTYGFEIAELDLALRGPGEFKPG